MEHVRSSRPRRASAPDSTSSSVGSATGPDGWGPLTGTPVWASSRQALPPVDKRASAEHVADSAEAGRQSGLTETESTSRSPLAADEGRPVDDGIRRSAEHLLGTDLKHARVHDGPQDRQFGQLLGARAATHGRDVFLGEGESANDEALLRHELAHVAEGADAVRLRSATWLERRAWLSFFSHYLPRRFLNNYMDDTGTAIVLTATEMRDCNPIVDLRRSSAFVALVASLVSTGGGVAPVALSGWGGALTNGTLGNFTIKYVGSVSVTASGGWSFTGTMKFHDYWDFDPKGSGSGRPLPAELKVRVAALALPGKPFFIDSVSVGVSQRHTDAVAVWGSGAPPTPTPDHAVRSGVDIMAGDVGAGPAGGEIGAQSSEDLNK